MRKTSLTTKAMLAKIECSIIGMRKKDAFATITANNALQTSQAAGMYQKCRISRENIIDAIRARDKATALHRKMTTPFTSDNWRLIGAELVMDYGRQMGNIKHEFESAVVDIVNRWHAIIAFEKNRLGPIFIDSEYPMQSEVAEQFAFAHHLKPIPDEGHIVVDLETEVLDEIKAAMRKENNENLRRSMKDLWKRLFDPVSNMADICGNDKKVFKSLIGKIEDIVDIMPSLNILNDPNLNDLTDEVKKKLTVFTVGQIKDDKILKKTLGKEAEVLANKVRNYIDGVPKTT